MNDEEIFMACFRSGILGVLLLVTLIIGSCQTTNYRIVQAIEAGATPMEAECALSSVSSSSHGCLLLYAADAESIRE